MMIYLVIFHNYFYFSASGEKASYIQSLQNRRDTDQQEAEELEILYMCLPYNGHEAEIVKVKLMNN